MRHRLNSTKVHGSSIEEHTASLDLPPERRQCAVVSSLQWQCAAAFVFQGPAIGVRAVAVPVGSYAQAYALPPLLQPYQYRRQRIERVRAKPGRRWLCGSGASHGGAAALAQPCGAACRAAWRVRRVDGGAVRRRHREHCHRSAIMPGAGRRRWAGHLG